MSNRTIEAILRVSSRLGSMAALSKVSAQLGAVDKKAKAFNRTQGAITKGTAAMAAAAARYAAPAILAAGAIKAEKAFATVERRMTRIGVTANASREEMAGALDVMRQLAQDLETPIDNVVDGLENLIASGKTLPEAMALLPSVARTAHAADAQFGEMATTADAISGAFGIAAGKMERAFDIIAAGGKAGKFELKDMAAQLPSLAPAFAALGYKGEEGLKRLTAAAQTVRMEVGSSGEAATSLMDVLTKMQSETVSNNFKKFGMNIRREMDKAKKNGEDTLEAFIRLSKKAVKGDLSKLPQLFTDKQMLIGMRALINHTGEFRDLLKSLGDAAGTVRGDIKRLSEDAQGDFDRLANAWKNLTESFGENLSASGLTGKAADVLDGAANNANKRAAARRGLKKRGIDGFLAQEAWYLTHGAGRGFEFDVAAREGGYRTAAERKYGPGYMAYGASRAAAPDLPVGQIPAPTARPTSGAPLQLPPPKYPTRAPSFVGSVFESEPLRPGQVNGELNALIGKIEEGGQKAGDAVSQGGDKAGEAISSSADAIRAAGQDAAAAIKGAAADLSRAASAARSAAKSDIARPEDL